MFQVPDGIWSQVQPAGMEGAGCPTPYPTPPHTLQQFGQSEEWQLEGSQLKVYSTVLNSHKNVLLLSCFVNAQSHQQMCTAFMMPALCWQPNTLLL